MKKWVLIILYFLGFNFFVKSASTSLSNYLSYEDVLNEFEDLRNCYYKTPNDHLFKLFCDVSHMKLMCVSRKIGNLYKYCEFNLKPILAEGKYISWVANQLSEKEKDFSCAIFCHPLYFDVNSSLLLEGLNLIGLNFSDASFIKVHFKNCGLKNNNFSGAHFYHVSSLSDEANVNFCRSVKLSDGKLKFKRQTQGISKE